MFIFSSRKDCISSNIKSIVSPTIVNKESTIQKGMEAKPLMSSKNTFKGVSKKLFLSIEFMKVVIGSIALSQFSIIRFSISLSNCIKASLTFFSLLS